ncbi:NAD(P)H-quinone oxidoreductase subunit 5, chloroplastic [Phlyctochytrium bullatum]|nr:NAD(P)H-quinone oxidoreductase subunit 5, chloroplastic [Phlyctochytrium bullatum]
MKLEAKSRSRIQLHVTTAKDILSLDEDAIKTPSPIDAKKLNSLQKAVHDGDSKKVKKLLTERKRDVNKVDSNHGITALHLAVLENKRDMVEILLDPSKALSPQDMKLASEFATSPLKICNVDCLDPDTRTPLILAVMHGNTGMAELLLQNGANVDATDVLECRPLHYAVLAGNVDCINCIMRFKPDLTYIDKSGYSYLQHALRLKHVAIANILIDSGVPVNFSSLEDRSTALHFAADIGSEDIIRKLIANGADPTVCDSDEKNVLSRLKKSAQNAELIDYLTHKILEAQARQELGKKSFLDFNDGSPPRSQTPAPFEETKVESVSFAGGKNKRMQQEMQRQAHLVPLEKSKRGDFQDTGGMGYLPEQGKDDEDEDEDKVFEIYGAYLTGQVSPLNFDDEISLSVSLAGESDSDAYRLLGLEKERKDRKVVSKMEELDLSTEERSESKSVPVAKKHEEEETAPPSKLTLSDSPVDETSNMSSANSKKDEESDLLEALGIQTEEISQVSDFSNPDALEGVELEMQKPSKKESEPSQSDLDSSPSLSLSSDHSASRPSEKEEMALQNPPQESSTNGNNDVTFNVADVELSDSSSRGSKSRESSVELSEHAAGKPAHETSYRRLPELPKKLASLKPDSPPKSEAVAMLINSATDESFRATIVKLANSPVDPKAYMDAETAWLLFQRVSSCIHNQQLLEDVLPAFIKTLRINLAFESKDSKDVASKHEEIHFEKFISPLVAEIRRFADKTISERLVEAEKKANEKAQDLLEIAEQEWSVKTQTLLQEAERKSHNQIQSLQRALEDQKLAHQHELKELDAKKIANGEEEMVFKKTLTSLRERVLELDLSLKCEKAKSEELQKERDTLIEHKTSLEQKIESLTSFTSKVSKEKNEETLDLIERSSLLQAQVKEKDAEIESLQLELSSLQNAFHNLKQDIVKRDTDKDEMERSRKDSQASVDVLKKQLSAEIEKRSAFQRETKYLRQLLKGYGASLDDLNIIEPNAEVISDDEAEENPFKKYCQQLEDDCLELQKRMAHESEERAALEKQIEEARFHSEEVSDELHELMSALKAEKKTTSALEERITIQSEEISVLKSRESEFRETIEKLEKDVYSKETMLKSLKDTLESKDRSIQKLNGELDTAREENVLMSSQMEARNSQVETLRSQLKEVIMKSQTEADNQNMHKSSARQEINEDVLKYYENEVNLLSQQFAEERELRLSREADYKRILSDISELEERLTDLKSLYEKQLVTNSDFSKLRGQLEERILGMEKERDAAQEKVRHLEEALAKSKSESLQLEDKLAATQVENEKAKLAREEELRVTKKQASELKERLASLESTYAEKMRRSEFKIAELQTEIDNSAADVIKFQKRLTLQKEEYEADKNNRQHEVEMLTKSVKEKERVIERLKDELAQLESTVTDTQSNLHKRLKDSESQRLQLKSDIEIANEETQKANAVIAALKLKHQNAELQLIAVSSEKDELAEKHSKLLKSFESEKKKSERYFKSAENLRARLSSFVDLSGEASSFGSTVNLGAEARQLPIVSAHKGASITDISEEEPAAYLRDLRSFMKSEGKVIEIKLSSLAEELGRDLARIESLQKDISADIEMESDIRELILRFLQSQTARVGEARGTTQALKLAFTSVLKDCDTSLEMARDSCEKEARRCKTVKDDIERNAAMNASTSEDIRKKKILLEQQYAELSAKFEIIDEEKNSLQKKLKESSRELHSLQDKIISLESLEVTVKDLKSKLSHTDSAYKEAKLALESQSDQNRYLAKEKERLESTFKNHLMELEEKDRLLSELKKQVRELKSEKSLYETNLGETESKSAESKRFKQKIEELEVENLSLKESLDTIKQENYRMQRDLADYANRRHNNSNFTTELQSQIADKELDWTKKRVELEAQIQHMTATNSRLESDRDRLEQQLRELRVALEENKSKVLQLEKAEVFLDHERKEALLSTQKLESQIRRLRGELEDALGIQRRLELERNSLREEITRSRSELRNPAPNSNSDQVMWEAERKKLMDELEKRTSALARAEEDALSVARQLKDITGLLQSVKSSQAEVSQNYRPVLEEKQALERALEYERKYRKDIELGTERMRRQFEEEIQTLMMSRKRAEERENHAENQKRVCESRIIELQELLEAERGNKHKLREEIHNIALHLRGVEHENISLKRKVESLDSSDLLKAQKEKIDTIEQEKARLKQLLHKSESQAAQAEARAKSEFDEKLKRIVVRLEDQSREREKLEAAREHTQLEMKEKYEMYIQNLAAELDSAKKLVELHSNMLAADSSEAMSMQFNQSKEELLRQADFLKHVKQQERELRGAFEVPRFVLQPRSNAFESRKGKKLRFTDFLKEEDFTLRRPNV